MGSAMVGYVCLLGANTNCLVRRSKFKVKVGGPIIGVLLAGGQARRMGGGDKCLVELGGKPLLAHAIERLRPQVDILLLNANGDPARFASFGLKVIADSVEGFAGPLAGILAGMEWAQAHQPGARFIDASVIVTVATDTPFFPLDLVARLREATRDRDDALAIASSAESEHYAFGLWPLALLPDLRRALAEGRRKAADFIHGHGAITVPFEAERVGAEIIDPFFNINEPQNFARAEALLKARLGRE
jgi:molybdopterin-guanine dinucleotide biosynthesis protein A